MHYFPPEIVFRIHNSAFEKSNVRCIGRIGYLYVTTCYFNDSLTAFVTQMKAKTDRLLYQHNQFSNEQVVIRICGISDLNGLNQIDLIETWIYLYMGYF